MQLWRSWLVSTHGRRLRVWRWDDTHQVLACVHSARIADHCGHIRCLLVTPHGTALLGCQDAMVRAFHLDPSAWAHSPGW
jgi:hypothetical protein